MTTEDRVFEARLADMLHRVTPEPPRGVTVEDVAIRLASQVGRSAGPSGRRNRSGPGRRDGKTRWTPLLAAASVVVVAGASTGIAVALSSHNKPFTPAGGVPASSSSSLGTSASTSAIAVPPATLPAQQSYPPGKQPWGASPNLTQTVNAGSLTGGDGGLFGLTDSALVKLNPVTGRVEGQADYPSGFPNQPPVIAGHTVWLVWNYAGGGVELRGFSTGSLSPAGDITVPASGAPTGAPDGILAATPAGHLWVLAGSSAKLVNPANGTVLRSIGVASAASTIATSPDGSRVYAGAPSGGGLRITEYDAVSGAQLGSWTAPGQVGSNLVASAGGVWVVTGHGTTGQLWFAPAGNLSGARPVATANNPGLSFVPTYAGGAVWIGGSETVKCLDPRTGSVRASAPVVEGNGAPGEFGDIAIGGGQPVALYLSRGLQAGGVTPIHPPASCAA